MDVELRQMLLGFSNKGRPVEPPSVGVCADAHTHLASLRVPAFGIAQCAALGVSFIANVCDPTDDAPQVYEEIGSWFSQAAKLLELAAIDAPLPAYRLVVGIHPHNARLATEDAARELLRLAADPRTCAIGEIGLDYHYDFSPRDVQRDVFARQIALANELSLPIQMHLREAHADALEILRREGVPQAGALVHCFNLGPEDAAPFIELGCHFSIGGPITFSGGDKTRAAVHDMPLDRIHLETDAPYMAPVPLRGNLCTPAMALFSLRRLMDELAVEQSDEQAFCQRIYDNTLQLFDREPVAWQCDEQAQARTAVALDGWVGKEDSQRMEAEYQERKEEFERAERERHEAKARVRAERRAKQEADRAAKQAKLSGVEVPKQPPRALVLVGSPRRGITSWLADELAGGLASRAVAVDRFDLFGKRIGGCIECDQCIRTGEDCFQTGRDGDDMAELDALLDAADLLVVATPLFFAGPPSQLKAVFDRFQPRWSRRYVHGDPMRRKRPFHLLITGTEADPYGHEPMVTIARSALAIAGFRAESASKFVLDGSESNGGRMPQMPVLLVDRANKLGKDLAAVAYRSQAGVWERENTPPDVEVHRA